jgi:L-alanine-DL-glutamate epimerase-like enolase superfamily enzyme
MVDANYAFDVPRAIEATKAFAPYDLLWFEEPIIPDDYQGYAKIAEATGMPLAMGENLHLNEEFEQASAWSKLSYVQPDASNCGGITGWLRVADPARTAGIRVCSHGMQELHVSFVAANPRPVGSRRMVSISTSTPPDRSSFRTGLAIAPDEPGVGVTFDWHKLGGFEQQRSTAVCFGG